MDDESMRGEGRNMRMRTIFILSLIFCVVLGTLGVNSLHAEKGGKQTLEEDPLVPGWSKDVRLTNASGDSMMPRMAIDSKNNIHVVWEDGRDEYWGIYYKRSIDYGNTWTEAVRLTPSSDSGYSPAITIDKNDTIHVVFRQWFSDGDEICYQKSMDVGETWSQPTRLTHASGDSFTPAIAVWNRFLHVVWSDERDGNFEIYYKKSLDGGVTWDEEDTKLSNTTGRSSLPFVAADSLGNIHVMWQEKEEDGYTLYYRKSLDGGNTWLAGKKLIENSTVGAAGGGPRIAIDLKDNLHVVWVDTRSRSAVFEEIFYKRSADYGNTWSEDVNISSSSIHADSFMPFIVSDLNNNLYLIWKSTNRTDPSNELYYKASMDGGDSWTGTQRLTYVVEGSRMFPFPCIDKNNVLNLVWYDQRTDGGQNYEIYYKRTLNPVTEPPITVTQSLNKTTCKPIDSITVSGNAVYNDSVVPNVNVSVKILETDDEWTTMTDSDGDYSKTITAPDTPGNYTIRVKVTWGNHTGWKQMRLTVEQENTNGGTTNGGTTNGGQQPDGEENNQGINFNYVIVTIGVIAMLLLIAGALLRMKSSTKVRKTKIEKTGVVKPAEKISTITLRCPGCKNTFNVREKEKPFNVKCPFCGKEGTIK